MWGECFAIQEDCPQLHSQGSSPNPVKRSELVIFIIEISIQSYTSYTWIDNENIDIDVDIDNIMIIYRYR